MILTEKLLRRLRGTNFFCSRLTNEQEQELLLLFGEEPYPEPPYVWDEEYIWSVIRSMVRY